ncbi:hypothetical protein C8R46DRAFT_1220635 [Mycena filopes]|nr:hypothetical protein C8R46DRAFT_1220635 [Mycena filopes]
MDPADFPHTARSLQALDQSDIGLQLLFCVLPRGQRPRLADLEPDCAHKKKRSFFIEGRERARFGDVYAYVNCDDCALANKRRHPTATYSFKCTLLNNMTSKNRAQLCNEITVFFHGQMPRAHPLWIQRWTGGQMDGSRRIDVEVHLFLEPNVAALQQNTPPLAYERYSICEDNFTGDARISEAINISRSRGHLIYRRLGLHDSECPGFSDLRRELQERYYGGAAAGYAKPYDKWHVSRTSVDVHRAVRGTFILR